MSVSGINNVSNVYSSMPVLQTIHTQDSDGDNDGGKRVSGGQGGGGFMQSVIQALVQTGIGVTQSPASSTNVTTNGVAGTSSTSSGTNAGQAFHGFMHDLFHAIKHGGQAQTGGTGNTAGVGGSQASSAQSGYADFTTGLQNLIQSLGNTSGAGNDSASGGSQGNLQSDFSNLVTALNGSSSPDSQSSPTLQSFLQTLLKNLQNQHSFASVATGGNISTVA